MATTSDQARIGAVLEVTPGTTPGTPAFEQVRLTSESISLEANTVESGELTPQRGVTDTILAGASSAGDVNSEVVSNTLYDDWLAAILGDTVPAGAHPVTLTVGTVMNTWTIEKTYINGSALQSYNRYAGVKPARVEFSYQPDEPLTAVWGMVGGELATAEDSSVIGDGEIVGATYPAPSPSLALAPAMRPDNVTVTWGGGLAALDGCHTSISLVIDSRDRERRCIGTLGPDSPPVQGKLMVQLTITLFFEDNVPIDSMVGQTDGTLVISMKDHTPPTDAHSITFRMDRVRIDQATLVTPATGEDVVYELTVSALVPAVGDQIAIDLATA